MVETADLSLRHHPVGGFLPPAARADDDRVRLTGEQIASFHERGYLPGIRVLDGAQVDALNAELASLMDPAHPANALFHEYHSNESRDPATVLFHALGAWRASPSFHDLLWAPGFLVPASQLLEGAVRFWHDQLFCKPPKRGGVVAWHQDYSYWTRTQPMAHLTCWIALDDVNEENGCLRYIPGSHRWDLLPITGLAGQMDAIEQVLSPEQRAAFTPVAVPLKRGEAVFHHPLTVHGSSENRSDRPRRGAVINAVRDGVRSASDEPLLHGVPVVPRGQPLSGQFFPLLYDPL